MKANPRHGRCQLCHLPIKKSQSSHSSIHVIYYWKKPLSSCSDASKITQLFHKTLLRGQQQICMVQYCNVYLKIIVERHHTVLSADKNLWCHLLNIIALEQNDNQAACKLYLGNIENFLYWSGILFCKWPMGEQSLVYYCTLQSCRNNYGNVSL